MTRPAITLASGSAIRAAILNGAGVSFDVVRPDVDEDVIKTEGAAKDWPLATIAQKLADAKCLEAARLRPGLVIGSDQIMEFEGRRYGKPKTMDEAKARLAMLAGKTHRLINAITVARDGDIIWRSVETPALTMRAITDAELDAYLAAAGADILASVGAYQVEGLGARLFERIDGDYFAVLGLSLYPLLAVLRREGALDF